jgi:sulfate-transporting ATPase
VTSVYGGVLAGVLASSGIVFTMLDRWAHVGQWFAVLSGIGLIITLVTNPEGLAAGGHALARRFHLSRPRRRDRTGDLGATEARVSAPAVTADGAGGPLLEVSDLRVTYGGVVAVDDVSLAVSPGHIVGLIGPNGAGKTSVIDAVTGFTRYRGHVLVGGASMRSLRPHRRARHGLVRTFQSLELYDDLSVEENVSVAVFGARADRHGGVARALELTGITELADRPAGELSQGERQLVSIARACAAQPTVLLLDEPAAGLDTAESTQLGERIRDIADSGTAVLLVDHDVTMVLGVCDRVYVLDLGRVIASGSPDEIRRDRAVVDAYLGVDHGAPAGVE